MSFEHRSIVGSILVKFQSSSVSGTFVQNRWYMHIGQVFGGIPFKWWWYITQVSVACWSNLNTICMTKGSNECWTRQCWWCIFQLAVECPSSIGDILVKCVNYVSQVYLNILQVSMVNWSRVDVISVKCW